MTSVQPAWTPDAYLEQLYRQTMPQYRFAAETKQQWEEWHRELKQALLGTLGEFPAVAAPLEPQLLEETVCGGYIRQRVAFTTYEGLVMPAYLLLPDGRTTGERLPAVVACHGHGYGSRSIVGLDQEGKPLQDEPDYQKQFAIELVKRGFIVLAPELLGFGDRRLAAEFGALDSSCHTLSTYLLQMGHTIGGHRVYETMRAIDYLQQRSDVDPQRIGCMGISGGGLVATFLAALDSRVKAAVVSGYIGDFKDSILACHHCVDNYVPGLNRLGELPDLAGLIAPRALLVESGTQDAIFPAASAAKAAGQITQVYRLLGVSGAFEHDVFAGGHEISGQQAYAFLERWLG